MCTEKNGLLCSELVVPLFSSICACDQKYKLKCFCHGGKGIVWDGII